MKKWNSFKWKKIVWTCALNDNSLKQQKIMLSGHCNKLLTFNEKYPHLILNISQIKQHLKNRNDINIWAKETQKVPNYITQCFKKCNQWEHVNLFSCSFHPEFIQYHHVKLLIHIQFYLPNHDLNCSDFFLFLS